MQRYHLLLLLIFPGFWGCGGEATTNVPDSRIVAEEDGSSSPLKALDSRFQTWAPGVVSVDAVVYDTGDGRRTWLVEEDGTMHSGIVERATKRLTRDEIARLSELVTGEYDGFPAAGCYIPHHGFIFYDSDSNIVAHLEVCFLCGHGRGAPFGGIVENMRVSAELRDFVRSLGLPVFETLAEWKEYFGKVEDSGQEEVRHLD